jgi:hypothetical protein
MARTRADRGLATRLRTGPRGRLREVEEVSGIHPDCYLLVGRLDNVASNSLKQVHYRRSPDLGVGVSKRRQGRTCRGGLVELNVHAQTGRDNPCGARHPPHGAQCQRVRAAGVATHRAALPHSL